jgi:hypothetical protein
MITFVGREGKFALVGDLTPAGCLRLRRAVLLGGSRKRTPPI